MAEIQPPSTLGGKSDGGHKVNLSTLHAVQPFGPAAGHKFHGPVLFVRDFFNQVRVQAPGRAAFICKDEGIQFENTNTYRFWPICFISMERNDKE